MDDSKAPTKDPLLEVSDLTVEFSTDEGAVRAVDGISFHIAPGETLGVVGESGCGKSVTALSIMQLIPMPPGRFVSGAIRFHGENLLKTNANHMRSLRGNRIGMIFQEPMTSLNPVFTVGDQIGEAVRRHQGLNRAAARQSAIEMLRLVGIPAPAERVDVFPHQLSGGMRQRVMIAMALSCKPDLLIADEPTTALDVTIQAQIIDLMKELQSELGMSILLITHDLGVVAESCDRVVVMYAGKVVEQASVEQIFDAPAHPYTRGLLRSVPGWKPLAGEDLEPLLGADGKPRLRTIPGLVPNLLNLPKGCRFQARCDRVLADCKNQDPPLAALAGNRFCRCLNPVPLVEAATSDATESDAARTKAAVAHASDADGSQPNSGAA